MEELRRYSKLFTICHVSWDTCIFLCRQIDEFLLQVIDDLTVPEEGSSGLKGGMELRVRVGDLVGVIQKKHPMGDKNRWFCDTGQAQVSSETCPCCL